MTLIPLMKRFERELGTRKFIVFLGMVTIFSIIFQVVAAQLLMEDGLRYSGPYPILGALLWLFHVYIPRLHPQFFGLLGFQFSEKSIQYAFGLQAVMYRGRTSLLPTCCGMLASYMVCLSPWNKFDLPDAIVSVSTSIFDRFLDAPPNVVAFQPAPANRTAPAPLERPIPQPMFQQLPPPEESSIEQLTSMGFEREAVLRALQESHNHVERAADRLLSGE
jgi:UBA/TS-N domain